MPLCKTCGQKIRFIQSGSRFIPVESNAVPFDLGWGMDEFYLPDGEMVVGRRISPDDAIAARMNGETLENGFVPHRKVCVKPKKKGNKKK